MADKTGVHKDGLLGQRIEILVLNNNGETSRRQANGSMIGISHSGSTMSQPTQGGWQNPQGGQPPQAMTAAQQWTAQQQQQQLPALPAPVYPPGMQPTNVQAPPDLAAANAQPTWQGATTQNAPMTFQFGSSAPRQQSPFGSQLQQGSAVDRQQSPSGPQPQQPTGNRQWGFQ